MSLVLCVFKAPDSKLLVSAASPTRRVGMSFLQLGSGTLTVHSACGGCPEAFINCAGRWWEGDQTAPPTPGPDACLRVQRGGGRGCLGWPSGTRALFLLSLCCLEPQAQPLPAPPSSLLSWHKSLAQTAAMGLSHGV